MLFNKQEFCQDINFPPKSIINDKIYLFLYSLISKIFLLDKKTNSEHFENCINFISIQYNFYYLFKDLIK